MINPIVPICVGLSNFYKNVSIIIVSTLLLNISNYKVTKIIIMNNRGLMMSYEIACIQALDCTRIIRSVGLFS